MPDDPMADPEGPPAKTGQDPAPEPSETEPAEETAPMDDPEGSPNN